MRAETTAIVHADPYQAGRQTAAELLALLGRAPDLVIVFVTHRHPPEPVLEGLWSVLPAGVRLLGCSSYAEITAADALAGSVTAMGIVFESVEWKMFELPAIGESSVAAGTAFGELVAGYDPKLVITLPDGAIDNAKFVRALQDRLGPGCPVAGGVASDGLEFANTFELIDRRVVRGAVVGLALRGPVTVATSARAGFQPLGVTRTATRVENDKIILELDGQSALEIYKDFLGPTIAERPNIGTEFPLAMIVGPGGDYMASDERSQIIRVVRLLDEERGALVCSCDVPEGAKLRMTRGTKEDLVAAAGSAASQALARLPEPKLALVFSCVGRRLVLGARCGEEVEAACRVLDPALPKLGFYTYGEIAPVDGTTMSHDETFALVLVGTEP